MIKEDGIETFRKILNRKPEDAAIRVRLKDGDFVFISPWVAQGLCKIIDALSPVERTKAETLDVLSLLYIYEHAVKDKILVSTIGRKTNAKNEK